MGQSMYKLLLDTLFKAVLSEQKDGDEKTGGLWRKLLVTGIVVLAVVLVQYSETMLNVHRIKAQHEIEEPLHILELKLQSCQDLLENTEEDLRFCRISHQETFGLKASSSPVDVPTQ